MIEGSFYLFENPRNLTPVCQMKGDNSMPFILDAEHWRVSKKQIIRIN